MPKTVVREGEALEETLRRFKRSVNKSGILYDVRRHEAFLPKSLRRKLKSEEARRRKY